MKSVCDSTTYHRAWNNSTKMWCSLLAKSSSSSSCLSSIFKTTSFGWLKIFRFQMSMQSSEQILKILTEKHAKKCLLYKLRQRNRQILHHLSTETSESYRNGAPRSSSSIPRSMDGARIRIWGLIQLARRLHAFSLAISECWQKALKTTLLMLFTRQLMTLKVCYLGLLVCAS